MIKPSRNQIKNKLCFKWYTYYPTISYITKMKTKLFYEINQIYFVVIQKNKHNALNCLTRINRIQMNQAKSAQPKTYQDQERKQNLNSSQDPFTFKPLEHDSHKT